MARRVGMQKDIYTQLAEATTPEERDRIVRRLRHAEVGQEGERGRVLDGLIVNGRDPYADLRGGRVRTVYEDQLREAAEERTERPVTVATSETMPRDVEAVLQPAPAAPGMMSITEAAERLGVKADKIRYLEQTGAIPPAARPNGRDRVYGEQDLAAIQAVLATPVGAVPPKTPAPVPTAPQTPVHKRASPTVPDRRHEIIYCPECRRQLSDEEYQRDTNELVMTAHGGIVHTLVHCTTHRSQPIAVKTEFVIRYSREEGDPMPRRP